MISNSIVLMTILDIVIGGLCVYGLCIIGANWNRLRRVGLDILFGCIGLSLVVFTTFFALELISMHVFPGITGLENSMQFMTNLHLNWSWPVHLLAVGVITYSIKRYVTDLLPRYLEKTESLSEQLAETAADFKNLSNRYHYAISGATDGFWYWDINSKQIWCSPSYANLLGLKESGELLFDTAMPIHPDDSARIQAALNACIKDGASLDITLRLKTAEPGHRWFRYRGTALANKEDRITHVAGSLQDVHQEREQASRLSELAIAVENSMEGISRLNTEGHFVEVHDQYAAMLGYKPDELIGQDWRATVAPTHHEKGEIAYQTMLAEGRAEIETTALRKDGSEFIKKLLMVKTTDEDGSFSGHYCFMRDVTGDTELKQKLEFQASHDSLTRLINRREFERRVERVLESVERGGEHVLCYMDLDQFKVINDTLGHSAGDELLRRLGDLMNSRIRSRDTLARLGGDEFALLMEHCGEEDGVRAANQVKTAIEEYEFHWASSTFKVGVSMGIVLINTPDTTTADLLKKADTACYIAKEQGRSRLHIYRELDHEMVRRQDEMVWVSRINEALAADNFLLYAQPIGSVTGAGAHHFEVLVRMRLDDEIILPGNFLPAAERYNVATQLDRWVIEHTFDLLLANPAEAFDEEGRLWSINLSGHSLGNSEFLHFVTDQLNRDSRLGPHICFEITETAAISKLKVAKRMIDELGARGCHFSLDDFGKSLSSFAYLRELKVDFLKIDGSIVKDIVKDESSRVMVSSFHDISRVMGKRTVAEWVEDAQTLDMLRDIGIDYAQGYHIGKPALLTDMLATTPPPEKQTK